MNSDQMKFTAAFALVALWAAFVFMKMASPDALLDFIKVTVGAIAGHWTASSSNSQAAQPMPAVPPAVAGRSLWAHLVLLAMLAICLAMLGGCTTTTASIARGYMTSAEAGVQAFDDNAIDVNVRLLCLSPYGAVVRHPEKQVGIQALCGSLANTSTLDANQLQLLMNVMSASGVKLQTAPASAAASGARP